MAKQDFAERIKRIERDGPSGTIIPGQIGEMTDGQARSVKKTNQRRLPRTARGTIATALLFGGILGAIVGLVFQHVVGVQALLAFDWQTEFALAQADMIRMAVWSLVACGAALALITLPGRKRFRRLAGGSLAYMGTAIAVNAQELMALLPGAVG